MKLLLLGLFPVIIFWLIEDRFGTLWGIVAAVIWAIGECGYEYFKNRRIEKLTLISTGLVVVLGGFAAWLDNGILFKFQPAIVEVVFAGFLYFGSRSGDSLLYQMAQKTRPENFAGLSEPVKEHQRRVLNKMSKHLIWVILTHAVAMAIIAVKGTTGQWAFLKGIGFYVFFGVWMFVEVFWMRWSSRRSLKK